MMIQLVVENIGPNRLQSLRRVRIFVLWFALCCLVLYGCDSKTQNAGMQLPTESKAESMNPADLEAQWLPSYNYLSDQLQLRIPPEFRGLRRDDKVPSSLEEMKSSPIKKSTGFVFFLPDYTGYTNSNFGDIWHTDRVTVNIDMEGMGQEQPDAPGLYPPNVYKRVFSDWEKSKKREKERLYGLECEVFDVRDKGELDSRVCLGVRNETTKEMIILTVEMPPYPNSLVFPTIRARYFSTGYGGVRIKWIAHAKHLEHWKTIDQQIWYWLDDWNIAKESGQSSQLPN